MWHRDTKTEQLLRDVGIKAEFRQGIPITKLKIEESLRNNARIDPLDQIKVDKYAFDMARGVSFPAPIITDTYIIMAGNQRSAAAIKANRSVIDAYVVSGYTQEQYDDLIRRDNTTHGKALTESEIMATCIELNRRYGRSLRELNNQYFGGNSQTYGRMIAASHRETVAGRLNKKGVAATRLKDAHLEKMHPVQDDNVLRDLGILTLDYSLSTDALADIVTEIGKKPSEAERKQVVVQKRHEWEARVKGVPTASPGTALCKQLLSFRKFLATGNGGKPFPQLHALDAADAVKAKADIDAIVLEFKRMKEKR